VPGTGLNRFGHAFVRSDEPQRDEVQVTRAQLVRSSFDLPEQQRDVDTAVYGDERPEPSRRLLQLPLAADSPPASGLVPRDDEVHEALEEVALRGLRRAPRELELLVRVEVPPGADQLETARELCLLRRVCHPATLPCVATILLCGVDLFFRGKLDALLPGHHLITVDSADEPEMVIVDIARVDPDEVADTYPDVPILGYTNHTDTAGLRAANAAGFDHVVVKSALVERVQDLVEELTASVE
jgi:hypothetical protein